MVGGVTGVIAINLLQYSVAIGFAGIASAVFNTDIVFLSSLAYFILNEPLSILQVVGIMVTTLGAVTLSFNEELLEKCGCRQKTTKIDFEEEEEDKITEVRTEEVTNSFGGGVKDINLTESNMTASMTASSVLLSRSQNNNNK